MAKISFKLLVLIIAIIITTHICNAQNGMWTWAGGSNAVNGNGDNGVLAIPAATNIPPARYQAAYWTDLSGNFWLFGGNSINGIYNDLWKYDLTINQWTWIHGQSMTSDQDGEFGVLGMPSINNYPSARGYGASCWTDIAGNLWL